MKDTLQSVAAAVILFGAGAGATLVGVNAFTRLSAVEAGHAGLIDDLNKKVLPEVQKQLEAVKQKTPAAPAAKKGD